MRKSWSVVMRLVCLLVIIAESGGVAQAQNAKVNVPTITAENTQLSKTCRLAGKDYDMVFILKKKDVARHKEEVSDIYFVPEGYADCYNPKGTVDYMKKIEYHYALNYPPHAIAFVEHKPDNGDSFMGVVVEETCTRSGDAIEASYAGAPYKKTYELRLPDECAAIIRDFFDRKMSIYPDRLLKKPFENTASAVLRPVAINKVETYSKAKYY